MNNPLPEGLILRNYLLAIKCTHLANERTLLAYLLSIFLLSSDLAIINLQMLRR